MQRIAFLAVLLMLTAVTATACNTMEGLGQDIQRGGQNLEGAADRNK